MFLFLLITSVLSAQTDNDYNETVQTIINYYNASETSKIFELFSDDLKTKISITDLEENVKDLKLLQGNFSEFDFMDKYEERRYLVQSDKDSAILSIALSPEKKLTIFLIE